MSNIIDNVKHPLGNETYRLKCKETLDKEGVLVLKELLQPYIIQKILKEAESQEHLAYFCVNNHNVYLEPSDNNYSSNHARNKTRHPGSIERTFGLHLPLRRSVTPP